MICSPVMRLLVSLVLSAGICTGADASAQAPGASASPAAQPGAAAQPPAVPPVAPTPVASGTAATVAVPAAAPATTGHQPHEELRPIAESRSAASTCAPSKPCRSSMADATSRCMRWPWRSSTAWAAPATLGPHFTPVSSLLDLIFCNAPTSIKPIVTIKHSELCHDLAQSVPEAEERETLRKGHISPRRLEDDAGVQAAIETLSRQTSKTKAINQVRRAHSVLRHPQPGLAAASPGAARWCAFRPLARSE
jgi:hypothetical protein